MTDFLYAALLVVFAVNCMVVVLAVARAWNKRGLSD
jgi:hypothetical protein